MRSRLFFLAYLLRSAGFWRRTARVAVAVVAGLAVVVAMMVPANAAPVARTAPQAAPQTIGALSARLTTEVERSRAQRGAADDELAEVRRFVADAKAAGIKTDTAALDQTIDSLEKRLDGLAKTEASLAKELRALGEIPPNTPAGDAKDELARREAEQRKAEKAKAEAEQRDAGQRKAEKREAAKKAKAEKAKAERAAQAEMDEAGRASSGSRTSVVALEKKAAKLAKRAKSRTKLMKALHRLLATMPESAAENAGLRTELANARKAVKRAKTQRAEVRKRAAAKRAALARAKAQARERAREAAVRREAEAPPSPLRFAGSVDPTLPGGSAAAVPPGGTADGMTSGSTVSAPLRVAAPKPNASGHPRTHLRKWLAREVPAAYQGQAVAALRERVVDYAKAQLGKPYVWGGAGPGVFDCSGLTMRALARAGLRLPHYTVSQWALGKRITRARLRPGDLVLASGFGHVQMYIGGGKVIHAPRSGDVVRVAELPAASAVDGYVTFFPRTDSAATPGDAGLGDAGLGDAGLGDAAKGAAKKAAKTKAAQKKAALKKAAKRKAAIAKKAAKARGFSGSTPVLMADGSTKAIREIDKGDMVLAAIPETGETLPRKVTRTGKTTVPIALTKLTLSGGDTLATTGKQKLYQHTRRAWTAAGDLHRGDTLTAVAIGRSREAGRAATTASVQDIARSKRAERTLHTLTVDKTHTFYAKTGRHLVLAHNDPDTMADGPSAGICVVGVPSACNGPLADGDPGNGEWDEGDSPDGGMATPVDPGDRPQPVQDEAPPSAGDLEEMPRVIPGDSGGGGSGSGSGDRAQDGDIGNIDDGGDTGLLGEPVTGRPEVDFPDLTEPTDDGPQEQTATALELPDPTDETLAGQAGEVPPIDEPVVTPEPESVDEPVLTPERASVDEPMVPPEPASTDEPALTPEPEPGDEPAVDSGALSADDRVYCMAIGLRCSPPGQRGPYEDGPGQDGNGDGRIDLPGTPAEDPGAPELPEEDPVQPEGPITEPPEDGPSTELPGSALPGEGDGIALDRGSGTDAVGDGELLRRLLLAWLRMHPEESPDRVPAELYRAGGLDDVDLKFGDDSEITDGSGEPVMASDDTDVELMGAGTSPAKAAKGGGEGLAADTKVTTPDGRTKAISKVKKGDKVIATDADTGLTLPRKVTKTAKHKSPKPLVDIATTDGQTITAAGDQQLYDPVTEKWVKAADLEIGGHLSQPAGDLSPIGTGDQAATTRVPTAISAIGVRDNPGETVHNLTVDGIHTFYTGTTTGAPVLAHNAPGDDGPQPEGLEGLVDVPPYVGSFEHTESPGAFKIAFWDHESHHTTTVQEREDGSILQTTGQTRSDGLTAKGGVGGKVNVLGKKLGLDIGTDGKSTWTDENSQSLLFKNQEQLKDYQDRVGEATEKIDDAETRGKVTEDIRYDMKITGIDTDGSGKGREGSLSADATLAGGKVSKNAEESTGVTTIDGGTRGTKDDVRIESVTSIGSDVNLEGKAGLEIKGVGTEDVFTYEKNGSRAGSVIYKNGKPVSYVLTKEQDWTTTGEGSLSLSKNDASGKGKDADSLDSGVTRVRTDVDLKQDGALQALQDWQSARKAYEEALSDYRSNGGESAGAAADPVGLADAKSRLADAEREWGGYLQDGLRTRAEFSRETGSTGFEAEGCVGACFGLDLTGSTERRDLLGTYYEDPKTGEWRPYSYGNGNAFGTPDDRDGDGVPDNRRPNNVGPGSGNPTGDASGGTADDPAIPEPGDPITDFAGAPGPTGFDRDGDGTADDEPADNVGPGSGNPDNDASGGDLDDRDPGVADDWWKGRPQERPEMAAPEPTPEDPTGTQEDDIDSGPRGTHNVGPGSGNPGGDPTGGDADDTINNSGGQDLDGDHVDDNRDSHNVGPGSGNPDNDASGGDADDQHPDVPDQGAPDTSEAPEPTPEDPTGTEDDDVDGGPEGTRNVGPGSGNPTNDPTGGNSDDTKENSSGGGEKKDEVEKVKEGPMKGKPLEP